MHPVWTCMVCDYTSTDPDLNFPTLCPSCNSIYSSRSEVFDATGRTDAEKKIEDALRLQAELVERRREQAARLIEQGRAAWEKLHAYRGCDPEFLVAWEKLIPSSCTCPESYQAYKAQDPPDFSSPMAFFAWGVRIHNRVNLKLGKGQVTLASAIEQWWPDAPLVESLAL